MITDIVNDIKLIGTFWRSTIVIPQVLLLITIISIISFVSGNSFVYSSETLYTYLGKLFCMFSLSSLFLMWRININNKKMQKVFMYMSVISAYLFFAGLGWAMAFLHGTYVG